MPQRGIREFKEVGESNQNSVKGLLEALGEGDQSKKPRSGCPKSPSCPSSPSTMAKQKLLSPEVRGTSEAEGVCESEPPRIRSSKVGGGELLIALIGDCR